MTKMFNFEPTPLPQKTGFSDLLCFGGETQLCTGPVARRKLLFCPESFRQFALLVAPSNSEEEKER